jgi:dipeptidyl aminopeptidase/acylaminoacyl peptidase
MKHSRKKSSFVQANDFAELQHPRELALSPDGSLLAYTHWWCDLEKKKYYTNIHVLDTKSGAGVPWTRGDQKDRSPTWSPDGSRLAFFRSEKGEDRIYLLSRGGGEAELLFKKRGSFGGMKWAEGGSSLVVKFRPADADADAEKALKEGREPEDKAPAIRKITRLFYRFDGDGFLPVECNQLFKISLADKKFVQLTQGKSDVGGYDVSPDGSQVVYVQNVQRDPDRFPFHQDLFLLNLKTRGKKKFRLKYGEKFSPSFAPNGKQLIYFGHHNMQDAWGVEPVHPYLVDVARGTEKNLTPGFDRQPGDHSIGDLGFGLDSPVCCWSRDGKSFIYQVTAEGEVYLVRKDLKVGKPVRLTKQSGCIPLFDMVNDKLVYHQLDFDDFGTLHICEKLTATPRFRTLKEFNRDYAQKRRFGKVRELQVKSKDGTRVQGWLLTPPEFSPRKKYPSILEIHGGPRAQYSRVFFHEMQFLAANGYVVLFTNPRGSQGYGEKFAGDIVGRWGTTDYEDVMAAADWLEAQPFIDKKRMGVTGGSYGGYMTNMIVGRTRRFRAAITQRSVFDLESFCGTSDIGAFDHYEFGGFHWENQEAYRAMNPIELVANIRTPLLIEHQENDMRCPIEQAEQMYGQLKLRGRTVEFHRYPEESHGMSRSGRPDRRVIRLEEMVKWFKKWMR